MSYPVMFCDEWNGDIPIRLDALAALVEELQRKYGQFATISFDAGANNVSVMIHPTQEVVVYPPWN